MFHTTQNKGFQMTFANGNTVSVQFGNGNYCNNRYADNMQGLDTSCENAEFLAWDKDGKDLCEATGWHTPEEIATLIAKYSA